mgnify:CR=1 FL=1
MIGKKQVSVSIVPVHLRDSEDEVGRARVVSNLRHKPTAIILGPGEGAIIGTFLHNADLTSIGVQGPPPTSSAEEELNISETFEGDKDGQD